MVDRRFYMTGAHRLSLGALVLLGTTLTTAAQPTADQGQLARELETGTGDQRAAAVRAISRIPATQRSPAVLTALINEVARLAAERDERMTTLTNGGTVEPLLPYPEYRFAVLEPLTQSDDPRVITALMSFITSGGKVTRALAGFGELAVAEVEALALLDGSTAFDRGRISGALQTLQTMSQGPVRNPLTSASVQRLVEVARRRLTGVQHFLIVRAAVGLAVATGDPSLIQRVRAIAESETVIQEFGILDPRDVWLVQSQAATVLEGL